MWGWEKLISLAWIGPQISIQIESGGTSSDRLGSSRSVDRLRFGQRLGEVPNTVAETLANQYKLAESLMPRERVSLEVYQRRKRCLLRMSRDDIDGEKMLVAGRS